MKCPSCGSEIDASMNYCPTCGAGPLSDFNEAGGVVPAALKQAREPYRQNGGLLPQRSFMFSPFASIILLMHGAIWAELR